MSNYQPDPSQQDLDTIDALIEEQDLEPECPMCDGTGAYLGDLGRLTWYRCINCGMDFHS